MQTTSLVRERLREELPHQTSYEEVESVNANELFERVKYLLHQNEENREGNTQKENNLREIIKAIWKKINRQWEECTKEFIGLLVVFVYVVKFRTAYYHSLNFHTTFFLNINHVFEKTYSEWRQCKGTDREQALGISLFTLLFTIGSIVQDDDGILRKKIPLKKLFNPMMMTTFLSCQFPDNAKLLHFYKVILLECSNRRDEIPQKSLLITSAFAHLLHTSSTECKATCLFVLNRSLKAVTSLSKATGQKLIGEVRKILFEKDKKLLYSLSLSVGSKVVRAMDLPIHSFLTIDEFLQILTVREEENMHYKDITGFLSFLKVLKEKKLVSLMGRIFMDYGHLSLVERIMNDIVPFLLPKIFVELMEVGLLEWMGRQMRGGGDNLSLNCETLIKMYGKAECLGMEMRLVVHHRVEMQMKSIWPLLSRSEVNQLEGKMQKCGIENYSGLH